MINIVNVKTHCNDKRAITSLEIKLKSIGEDGKDLTSHSLVATISSAFYKTTLLTDEGGFLKTQLDKRRRNVVDLTVNFYKGSKLTFVDVANFINAFQKAIDEEKLF